MAGSLEAGPKVATILVARRIIVTAFSIKPLFSKGAYCPMGQGFGLHHSVKGWHAVNHATAQAYLTVIQHCGLTGCDGPLRLVKAQTKY